LEIDFLVNKNSTPNKPIINLKINPPYGGDIGILINHRLISIPNASYKP
jgi:hypothetical protein